MDDAVTWLKYTYLYIRMLKNPIGYGIPHYEKEADPHLHRHCRELVIAAAKKLDECQMIRYVVPAKGNPVIRFRVTCARRYEPRVGTLAATDLGRVASHFYIQHDTIRTFNELLKPDMTEIDILATLSQVTKFFPGIFCFFFGAVVMLSGRRVRADQSA